MSYFNILEKRYFKFLISIYLFLVSIRSLNLSRTNISAFTKACGFEFKLIDLKIEYIIWIQVDKI